MVFEREAVIALYLRAVGRYYKMLEFGLRGSGTVSRVGEIGNA